MRDIPGVTSAITWRRPATYFRRKQSSADGLLQPGRLISMHEKRHNTLNISSHNGRLSIQPLGHCLRGNTVFNRGQRSSRQQWQGQTTPQNKGRCVQHRTSTEVPATNFLLRLGFVDFFFFLARKAVPQIHPQ